MCILFIAVNQHPDYPLIIAANRDEFHARMTTPAFFWDTPNAILAGKDEQAGGTWMGVTRSGTISALTNIRAPSKDRFDAKTRGDLVLQAVVADDYRKFTKHLKNTASHYNGFNLLYGNFDELHVFNSHSLEHHRLRTGVYGLSNAQLNTPWPKVRRGVESLNKACQTKSALNIDHLFDILTNRQQAEDDELPDTGIAKPWEKMLSSIFICTPDYGTRSSTVLLVDNNKQVLWQERSYDAKANEIGRNNFQFHTFNE